MLICKTCQYYKVKEGQTLTEIAEYFSVSPRVLAQKNGLKNQPRAGQILVIPPERANAYTVRKGDTKVLLCGSEERFFRLNGTECFYVGMKVWL